MTKVVIVEYDADENSLRLPEPLVGVQNHQRIRISIDEPHRNGDRAWLDLRGILSPEAGDSLAAAIDEMFGSAE